MSDTNRTKMSLVEETTFGTTPSNPTWVNLRVTGEPNMSGNPQTIVSNEIRNDRQITDLILVGKEAGGDVGFEIAFNTLDEVFEGALFNDWDEQNFVKNTSSGEFIEAITQDGTFWNVSVAGDNFVGTDLVTQAIVRHIGFTNSANNGIFDVVSVAQTSGTQGEYQIADSESTLVAETPPANAEVRTVGFFDRLSLVTSGGNQLVGYGGGVDMSGFDLEAGDWIYFNGFSTANADGYARLSAVAASALTFDIVPTGFAAEGAVSGVHVYVPDTLKNGTTEHSYSLERIFEDHTTTLYEVFTGGEINQLQVQLDAKAIMVATATFMCKDNDYATTRTSGSTDKTANTNNVMNTSSNVGRIAENGTALTSANGATQMQLTINNNLRRKEVIGEIGTISMGVGEFGLSGSMTFLFEDSTIVSKIIDNTSTSLDFRVADSDSHVLLFDMPHVKYASGGPNVAGKNQEVDANIGFQAIRHGTLGYTLKICRFYGVETS